MSDKKNNTYIKLHSYNSNLNYNSQRISFTERKDENKHNKELFKSYIEQKFSIKSYNLMKIHTTVVKIMKRRVKIWGTTLCNLGTEKNMI